MRRHQDRELAFRARFRVKSGILTLNNQRIGEITGQLIVPIHALYRGHPPPGKYLFHPADRGQLVPARTADDVGGEIIIETMGSLEVDSLLKAVEVPDEWVIVPAELLAETGLEAEIEFEDVDADDEYKLNEPADLEDATRRFAGRWRLMMPFPLEVNVDRREPQATLDRYEFELDGRFARLEALD